MPISPNPQASDLGFCESETTVLGHNQQSPSAEPYTGPEAWNLILLSQGVPATVGSNN